MRVPRIAEAVLRLFCRDEVGRDVVGDLSEEFNDIARRRGPRAARRWYRRQAVRSALACALASAGCLTAAPAVAAGVLRSAFDLGPAMRSLRRVPWYSATVVAVVALSIALATTVFAVVDGVLFKPLPYADPERLVKIELGFERDPDRGGNISPEVVERWQEAMPEVPLTALRVDAETGLERLNEPGLGVALVRANLLEVLGVRALFGGFTRDDFDLMAAERPTVRPVLITYAFWQQRFSSEIDAVGKVVAPVDPTKTPIRIAGVLPPGFVVPAARPAQLLMPSPAGYAGSLRRTTLLARLPDGLSTDAFRSQLEAAMARSAGSLADQARGSRLPDRAIVVPIAEGLAPWEGPALQALFAAVALLVLVACFNVSGLMTARCLDRARDIGLRRAIGARARDVVALLLAEHLLLFAAGAAIGVAAAWPLIRLVAALLPPTLHLLKTPAFDVRVAAFAALAVALSFVVASIWPIRRALRPELQQLIAGSGGAAVTLRTSGLGSRVVTTGQVAGTIVLVVAGGLLVASLLRVKANETGYQPDEVVVAELAMAPWLDGNPAWNRRPDVRTRLRAFLGELGRLPGVAAVGAADVGVLVGSVSYASRFDPVGRPPDPTHSPGTITVGDAHGGLRVPVTAGFFRAAGLQPLEGRLPTDEELMTGAPVVAISRTFARRNFPDLPAVGQRLQHTPAMSLPTFEIVGVVEDPRFLTWDGPVSSAVFTPYATFGGDPDPVLFVRAERTVQAAVMTEIIRRAESQRPFLRPVRVQTATTMLGDTIRIRRLRSWLFGSFAAASLVLAGVGLLGLVAMTMTRRTREIGIRMALGATRDRLVSGLVREQLMPVLAGLAAGALLAAWAVRFLESYVYELSVYDARVWAVAIVIVTTTAVTGALIPSLRASRVDPVRALRVE